MRLLLLHNGTAGAGFSADALVVELKRHGHDVVHILERSEDVGRLLDPSLDLVVVAGGDGTVSTAALTLAGHSTPLAILPLGTANNIATSLGIRGSVSELIERWPKARRIAMDLGVAAGAWGETGFVEGVGAGLVSAAITALSNAVDGKPGGPDDALAKALRGYRKILAQAAPQCWSYTLDGAQYQEELLILEVLNISSVGPNLELAPGADPADGYLSIVTADEHLRPVLDEYLQSRLSGKPASLALPTRAARSVTIASPPELHIDDHVRRSPSLGDVSIRVRAAALQVIV